MHYLLHRGERDYVKVLKPFIVDHVLRRHSGILTAYLLGTLYSSLLFLTWSRVWCEATTYETRHCVCGDKAYFVGWENRDLYMIPSEKHAEFYVKVPSWWRQ